MNEEQRLDYLRPMGYQAYYPRFVIPGARPSPRYSFPEPAPPQRQTPVKARRVKAPGSGPQQAPGRETIQQAKAALREVTTKPAGRSVVRQPWIQKLPSEAGEEVRFHLQYFAISRQLAVVSESPHQLRAPQTRDSILLLSAILRALVPVADQEVADLRGERFDWPLAAGLGAENPRRAAALALKGFINERQEQDGFANLLLFTTQLPHILTGDDQAEAAGDLAVEGFQCQLTFSYGLYSMLAHPLLKREVWDHLQALRRRLRNPRGNAEA